MAQFDKSDTGNGSAVELGHQVHRADNQTLPAIGGSPAAKADLALGHRHAGQTV